MTQSPVAYIRARILNRSRVPGPSPGFAPIAAGPDPRGSSIYPCSLTLALALALVVWEKSIGIYYPRGGSRYIRCGIVYMLVLA